MVEYMPVHEIKNPVPPFGPAVPRSENPGPVRRPTPVIRIKRYQGRQEQAKQRPGGKGPALIPAADEKMLRLLLRQFNDNLERHGIPLHLVLLVEDEGYLLEIYDCTRQQVCMVLRDLEIQAGDLPALLGKLQREAGLLVDTIS
jgi:hypothetical protein